MALSTTLIKELRLAVTHNSDLSKQKTSMLKLKKDVIKSLQENETKKSELTLQVQEAKTVMQRHAQRKTRLQTTLNTMMKVKMKAYSAALQKNSVYDAQRQVEEVVTKEQAERIKQMDEKRHITAAMSKCNESCASILSGMSVMTDALKTYQARPQMSTQTETREWKIEKAGQIINFFVCKAMFLFKVTVKIMCLS
jgi:hypothetical protein